VGRFDVHSQSSRSFAPPSVLPDISPTRGEIGQAHLAPHIVDDTGRLRRFERVISPLVGEMSGRTEGGNVKHLVWPKGGPKMSSP